MRARIATLYQIIGTSPIKIWVLVFIVIMVLLPQSGGGNESARLATMAALTREGSFSIDQYRWTQDWAVSPVNGRLYANKPPGPAIIGAPVYWLLDQLITEHDTDRALELYKDRELYGHVISLLTQALPYALLTLLVAHWLQTQGILRSAILFGTLGMLFGTTAAFFMGSYFGHGMAALFILAATLCLLRRQYSACGWLLGWAALCDYGAALLTLSFILGIIVQEKRQALLPLARIGVGALFPALIWSLYHWTIFGHPFHIASRFSNPAFITSTAQYHVWGLFSASFNGDTLLALLIGTQRGLLVTQPWILLTLFLALELLVIERIHHKNLLVLFVLAVSGLGTLLLFNSSFNGWNGGWTPGPRYLSSVLPLFGIMASLIYSRVPPFLRVTLWLSLLVSLVLYIFAYATTILAPPVPIWPFYWNTLWQAQRLQPMVNMVTAAIILLGLTLISVKDRFMIFLYTHTPQTHRPNSRGY